MWEEAKEEMKQVILGDKPWIYTTEDLDAACERVLEYIKGQIIAQVDMPNNQDEKCCVLPVIDVKET